jgi:predicted 3-demethylubiquinone-9 3-methyltransferase (glyoxalase superfamily)
MAARLRSEKERAMQQITPFLWFDSKAEEAANFYVSLFPNSKIGTIARYSQEGANASGMPKGSVMTIAFELSGQKFTALNGGPLFKFTEAISFMVNCDTQEEIDRLWEKLSDGGQKSRCGWLKDRYGLSWQIVPTALGKLMSDPVKAKRVMKELLQMDKLDITRLERAAGAE